MSGNSGRLPGLRRLIYFAHTYPAIACPGKRPGVDAEFLNLVGGMDGETSAAAPLAPVTYHNSPERDRFRGY